MGGSGADSSRVTTMLASAMKPAREMSPDDLPWPIRLIVMLLGYASIAVPTAALIYYVKKKHLGGTFRGTTTFGRFIKQFAIGNEEYSLLENDVGTTKRKEEPARGFFTDCFTFLWCAGGIQLTLVGMGWLQEKIITQRYPTIADPVQEDKFKDVQFLVFCNRIIALILAISVISFRRKRQPPHVAPYYVHSYTSFSNTISSWCQYEALKYVSFPTQTICKVSKVVATMMMGRAMRGQRYSLGEYGCGVGIAVGAGLFLLNTGSHSDDLISTTSISGICLMLGYLVFDSFTLNWQKVIFDTKPKISRFQMMLGVNSFSAVLCLVSLLEQGTLWTSISFGLTHENFMFDNIIFSLCGAFGQFFIYATIDNFGPIVFAVIMTVRQIVSIVLSSIFYGHPMTVWSVVGLMIAFGSMFGDIYRRYFIRKSRVHTSNV